MKKQIPFLFGSRIIPVDQQEHVDLGPLDQLTGTWKSADIPPDLIAQGWNTISVPGPEGFVFEVIPYTETLTFQPIVVAANKGPFIRGKEVTQDITGLIYEQSVISACPKDKRGKSCSSGFPFGTQIHAETGLLLNFKQKNDPNNPSGGFDFARLSTIPHGNSVLALGHATTSTNPGNDFFSKASSAPTNLDGTPPSGEGILFGYAEQITNPPGQFPKIFNQVDPNSFLKKALGNDVITKMTTLDMRTNNANAGGGILNIPFIQSNANATTMDAIFWIETIKGKPELQLQYTQTINLVFPPTGSPVPIVWPHVTIDTLTKVSNT